MAMASNGGRSKGETMKLTEELRRNIRRAEDVVKNKVKFEDVVMFIGNTKSGKSSLINSLMGNPLVARKNDKYTRCKPLHVYKADDAEGPEIGCDSKALTTEPSRWVASEECDSFVLYDCPGFCDNRGPVQSITNAYYIHHIFQEVKSVKIALVVDVNDIVHDKVNSFLSLLTLVENIFRDMFDLCFSSFVIIFTKVPPTIEDEPTDVDYLREILQRKCLSSKSLHISESSRNLVQHFIDHPESIGIFKKATEGEISNDIKINVIQALRCSSQIPARILKKYSFPSIDCDSAIFLHEIKDDLASKENFDEIVKFIQNVFDNIVTEFDKESQNPSLKKDQIIELKEKLSSRRKQIESANNAAVDILTTLQALKEIDPAIKNKINNSEIETIVSLMKFIDGLLNMAESELWNITIKSVMEHFCFLISDIIVNMQCKMLDIKPVEAQEMLKNLRDKYENTIEELRTRTRRAVEQNAEASKSTRCSFDAMGQAADAVIALVLRYIDGTKWGHPVLNVARTFNLISPYTTL